MAFQTQTQNRSVLSYAIAQIATLPPVVALNRKSKLQIVARYSAFWHALPQIPQIALASFQSQHFKSQRLQDANATKSQTLAFYKSQRFQRFSATKAVAERSEKFTQMSPCTVMILCPLTGHWSPAQP